MTMTEFGVVRGEKNPRGIGTWRGGGTGLPPWDVTRRADPPDAIELTCRGY